jgi:hypothetical protein
MKEIQNQEGIGLQRRQSGRYPVTTNASIVPVMKRTRDLSQGPQVALISPALELFKALEFGVRFITGFMLALVGTGDVHANVTLIRLLRLHMIRTQQS